MLRSTTRYHFDEGKFLEKSVGRFVVLWAPVLYANAFRATYGNMKTVIKDPH